MSNKGEINANQVELFLRSFELDKIHSRSNKNFLTAKESESKKY